MAQSEQTEVRAPRFGPTSGAATGWSGLVICAVVIASAAFMAHSLTGVRLILGALLAAVLIWCFLLRSRVILEPETVVLRNAFMEHAVPYGLIDALAIKTVTCVYVGEKRYVGAGVGHTVRALVRRSLPHREAPPPLPRGQLNAAAIPDFVEARIRERMRLASRGEGRVTRRFATAEIAALLVLLAAMAATLVL